MPLLTKHEMSALQYQNYKHNQHNSHLRHNVPALLTNVNEEITAEEPTIQYTTKTLYEEVLKTTTKKGKCLKFVLERV